MCDQITVQLSLLYIAYYVHKIITGLSLIFNCVVTAHRLEVSWSLVRRKCWAHRSFVSLHSWVLLYGTRTIRFVFAARNNATKEQEKNRGNKGGNEIDDAIEYDDEDDEIDEFEEVMKQLEPKYRRYANWRIWMLFETVYRYFRWSSMQDGWHVWLQGPRLIP